jgi:hypothetical protein
MSATAPAASSQRRSYSPVTPIPTARAAVAAPTRTCPYCTVELAPAAKKCRWCGEWLVRTSAGLAPPLLRLLAWLWAGMSLAGAAGVWYGGALVRNWVVAQAVEPVVALVVVDLVRYALVVLVALQGVTFATGLAVVASLAPRRPRWWT